MSGSSRHCDSPGGSRHTPVELSQQPQHGSPYSVVRRSSLLKYVPAAGSMPSQHSPSSNYVNVRSFSSGAQGTANVSAIDRADQCTDSTSRDADRDDMQQQARNVKTVFIPAPPRHGPPRRYVCDLSVRLWVRAGSHSPTGLPSTLSLFLSRFTF